jgi:hypothetical protein
MAASIGDINRVRSMVADPTAERFDNEAIAEAIERYPARDARGEQPYTWDASTIPPTQEDNPYWIPTYDLHAAAGDLWEEKAGSHVGEYDFSDSQASYKRSQAYDQCMERARYHRSRTCAKSVSPAALRNEVDPAVWIGNLAENPD